MKPYLDLLQRILDDGERRLGSHRHRHARVFGHQMRFDLAEGFPLLTTKKLHLRSIIHELLWFLRGDTNVALPARERRHDLGRMGRRGRRPRAGLRRPVALLADARRRADRPDRRGHRADLRDNPDSRRLIVSAWNVADVDEMALPPCHALFQFYVADGRLSCQLYQRSADVFLGVPFNIASYALLTLMIAQVAGLEPGDFVHTFGDAHLYLNHLEQARDAAHPRAPAAAAHAPQPQGRLDLRLPLRGLRARGLRPAPAHQGADRGLNAASPANA